MAHSTQAENCTAAAGDLLTGGAIKCLMLRLKEIREARGLTLQQLGDRLGKSHATVQRWEAGKRTPDANDIRALAVALRVKAGELFDDWTPEREDAVARQAVEIAKRLTPDQRAMWFTVGLSLTRTKRLP